MKDKKGLTKISLFDTIELRKRRKEND